MIIFQKTDDFLTHTIVTRFTDKCSIHANTPQRDQTVEHRTARHSPYRLVVPENNVENRFANTNYFTHSDEISPPYGAFCLSAGKVTKKIGVPTKNRAILSNFAHEMTKYNTYTLKNGLRIIHLPSDSQVVFCGYDIAAGTRNELPGEEGLAHFCEHMSFKGTARRNAIQIINAIEGLGGELNAFTNKEDTVYYAAISKEHFSQVINVLTDIVFHSQYPQHEIDKEVEVICDEIESYNDSPAELIYDEFENLLFEGHPLGHNILGNAEQLHTYSTADALRFVSRN